jgi:hypothetical protein
MKGAIKALKKVQYSKLCSICLSITRCYNDKHLEVIIKQMTTKVLITYEGDTPLLRREVIDLYHSYINEIVNIQKKTNGLLCSIAIRYY